MQWYVGIAVSTDSLLCICTHPGFLFTTDKQRWGNERRVKEIPGLDWTFAARLFVFISILSRDCFFYVLAKAVQSWFDAGHEDCRGVILCCNQRIRISCYALTRCSDGTSVRINEIEINPLMIDFPLRRESYQQLLLTQWSHRFKEILSKDNYTQMVIEDETKHQLLLRQFPLRIEAAEKVS